MALSLGKPVIFYCDHQQRQRFYNEVHPLSRVIDFQAGVAVCAMVASSPEEVTELLKLPFDCIFFTGSTKVGRIVMKAAAENLTPVLLELGGQNPALADKTANIGDAAKKIVWGAMAWGGQWCTSPGYAYVHELVAEAFVAEAKAALIALYGKDPKANPDYSRIIGARGPHGRGPQRPAPGYFLDLSWNCRNSR